MTTDLMNDYARSALAAEYGLTSNGDSPICPAPEEAFIRAQAAGAPEPVVFSEDEIADMQAFQEQLQKSGVRLNILDQHLASALAPA